MRLEDDPTLPIMSFAGVNFIGVGVSGMVFPLGEDKVVKKAPGFDNEWSENYALKLIQTERQVYQRLGSHPRICKYISSVRRGIVLERLGVQLRRPLFDLQKHGERLPYDKALKWSCQVAEGLAYIHQRGVLQGDIGCHNLLLDKDDNLKFTDFAGSAYDDIEAVVCYERRSRTEPYDDTTIETELFALGSVIYEIWTSSAPYRDKTDEEVEEMYKNKCYADVTDLPVGKIIHGCWHGTYATADEVLAELESLPKVEPKSRTDVLDTLGSSHKFLLLLTTTITASYLLTRWLKSQ